MENIMLVDDQEIANLISKKLIQIVKPNCQVHDFTDGNVALAQLEELKPGMILLDLNMPIINGWEFLEQMQQRHLTYPVCILTSSTSELDQNRAADFQNVIRYVTKPLDKSKITEIFIHSNQ